MAQAAYITADETGDSISASTVYNSKINVVAYRDLCRITSMINFSRNH